MVLCCASSRDGMEGADQGDGAPGGWWEGGGEGMVGQRASGGRWRRYLRRAAAEPMYCSTIEGRETYAHISCWRVSGACRRRWEAMEEEEERLLYLKVQLQDRRQRSGRR